MVEVVAFPLTAEARLRGRIVRAISRRVLDRCMADVKTDHRAGRLDYNAFVRLVAQASVVHYQLQTQEAAHG